MPAPRRSLQRETSSVSAAAVGPEPAARHSKSSPRTSPPPPQQGPGAVAIDLGSYTIRIAIAKPHGGGPAILTHCPNAMVRSSQKRYAGGSIGTLAGPQIALKCTNYGSLAIRQPMDRGMIVDWPVQKTILDLALVDALGKEKVAARPDQRLLEGRNVIVTEAYFNLPDLQAALDLLFLEEYGAAKIWRCAPALLIPYQPALFPGSQGASSAKKRLRPECMCIVDLGHNATHVVPVLGDAIVWAAVRRHIVSQRLLTNLLKETLSFRQWDMMDEAWLVGHIKERCCFVANSAGRRGEVSSSSRASEWSYAAMMEMCAKMPRHRNRLALEYVLPDYSHSSAKGKLGHVRGRKGAKWDAVDLDSFIVGHSLDTEAKATERGSGGEDETDDDKDDESDGDFREEASDLPAQPKKKAKTTAATAEKKDSEVDQVLFLEKERFQVPEVMFDPGIIGLDDAPLHQVIAASIGACEKDLQGPLWANIVLVGGGAKMRGIKERLFNELRPQAPVDGPVDIWMPDAPSLSAVRGAQSLLSESHRLLAAHLLSASEYSVQASRERFGSWSSLSSTP